MRQSKTLPRTGEVSVDGQIVHFVRPGLVEEYTVSMDGVRQDFVVLKRPELALVGSSRREDRTARRAVPTLLVGELRLELGLSGAVAEATPYGAKLTLDVSGRTLTYSRLRVSDATGKELPARLEVLSGRDGFHAVPDRRQDGDAEESVPTSGWLPILVDDTDAVYPIHIDPTFSDAN